MANPLSSFIVPVVFDRADGSAGQPGTAAPAGSIKFNSSNGAGGTTSMFEEESDSPVFENGDQNTITHRFWGDKLTIQTVFLATPRGTTSTDTQGNTSRVLTTNMKPRGKTNANIWELTITSECISFGHPPDEFSVAIVELNPALEKHPRYSALTYNQRYQIRGANVSDNQNIAQQYKNVLSSFPTNANPALNQNGQGFELLYKKQKGEDSFYLAGYKVTWSQYFWYPQTINPGGYIEDPISQGGLPCGFWSTNGTPQGTNIFANTTAFNANMFPVTTLSSTLAGLQSTYPLSWLRQADTFDLNRTWFKLTKSWLGGPIAQWDNELYNKNYQPLVTSGSVNILT